MKDGVVSQSEDLIMSILKDCGIEFVKPIFRWTGIKPKFEMFRFHGKSGAIELDGIHLRIYLYYTAPLAYNPGKMEIYNSSLANPDSLEKLRATLADQKQAISCVLR